MIKPNTQIDAWNELQSSVSGKRLKVLSAIKSNNSGLTLFEIVKEIGWPINRVSGRVTELKKMKKIKDSGTRRINPISGKNGIVWVYNE